MTTDNTSGGRTSAVSRHNISIHIASNMWIAAAVARSLVHTLLETAAYKHTINPAIASDVYIGPTAMYIVVSTLMAFSKILGKLT